jgi:hypothetical protein
MLTLGYAEALVQLRFHCACAGVFSFLKSWRAAELSEINATGEKFHYTAARRSLIMMPYM